MTATGRKFSVASVTRDLQAVEDAMNVMLDALENIYETTSNRETREFAQEALRKVKELGTHSLQAGGEQ